MTPQVEKDFAHDVFGGRAVGDPSEHEAVDCELIAVKQQRDRTPIALRNPRHEGFVRRVVGRNPGAAQRPNCLRGASCGCQLTQFTVCGRPGVGCGCHRVTLSLVLLETDAVGARGVPQGRTKGWMFDSDRKIFDGSVGLDVIARRAVLDEAVAECHALAPAIRPVAVTTR